MRFISLDYFVLAGSLGAPEELAAGVAVGALTPAGAVGAGALTAEGPDAGALTAAGAA